MKKFKQHIHSAKEAHDLEHEEWSRRSFLQTLGIGAIGGIFLGGNYISAASYQPMLSALNQAENDRVLVLIRLAGGNDGLNTIVPVNSFDIYAQNRPTIYHQESSLISLNDSYAMPNFMSSLESMWGDGKMKVVHGVGYENQSSSHFAGNDIISTANVDRMEDLEAKGWLGSYFNNQYDDFLTNPPDKPLAIQIGSSSNLVFNYEQLQYAYLVANPEQLESIAQSGLQFSLSDLNVQCKSGQQLQYLRSNANNTYKYAGAIHDAYTNSTSSAVYQENNSLADQLSLVARMVKGGLGTKIYMVTIGGFDTHANQLGTHQTLLTQVSEAITSFYKDLEATGHDHNVLSMTFSEFGRRVPENGSAGTDHGKAAPALLFGPALDGNGFIGEHPDMNNITTRGDIEYTTDFRRLYSTVLSNWLCANDTNVEASLNGSFEAMDLGFNCSVASTDDTLSELNTITSYSYFEDGATVVKINSSTSAQMKLKLYNIIGQEMQPIDNTVVSFSGSKAININQEFLGLSSGYYVYELSNDNFRETRKVLVK